MKELGKQKQKHTYKTHRHRPQFGDSQRERGQGMVVVGKGGEGRWKETLLWVMGTHAIGCADDVFLGCALETCMVL